MRKKMKFTKGYDISFPERKDVKYVYKKSTQKRHYNIASEKNAKVSVIQE